MRARHVLYAGSTLLAALIVAIGAWEPMAQADSGKGHGPKAPRFEVDASWPKPLPAPVGSDGVAHTWVTGEIAGNCVDQRDNVYTFNRGWETGLAVGGVLQGNESGAIVGQDASASSIPSPPIVAYDSEGNTIAGWGNPSLIPAGNVDYGFAAYLPHGAHGCFIDYQGNIWIGGNGDGIVQKYNPHIAAAQGAGATFEMQIGVKAHCDGVQSNSNPFSSCTETNDFNNSHTLLNEPPDIAVDPLPDPITGKRGDIYIADGYGNHRIVVFDADGNYLRQWGTKCMLPNASGVPVPTNSPNCPPGTFGATGGGHPHCVVLGNDGLVYVCDRPNSRIQVFSRSCGAASIEGPASSGGTQPLCAPVRVININNFPTANAGDRAAILLAGTRACDMDFWPNVDALASASPTRQSVIVNTDLGNDNTWLLDKLSGVVFGALGSCGIAPCPGHNAGHFAFGHTNAVDSRGDIYVAETITGRRIQKFVRTDRDDDDR